jgi:hypothetical protein
MNLLELQNLLRQAGWPDIQVATKVGTVPLIALFASFAQAESSGNPSNRNLSSREDSVGLWQINRRAHAYSIEALKDPLFNAQVAYQIYLNEGLRAWGVYTDNSFTRPDRGNLPQSIVIYNAQNGAVAPPPISTPAQPVFEAPSYESDDFSMYPTFQANDLAWQPDPAPLSSTALIGIAAVALVALFVLSR